MQNQFCPLVAWNGYLAVCLLVFGLGTAASSQAGTAHLVENGQSHCAVVVDDTDALCNRTAETLAEYLHEHTGSKVPVLHAKKANEAKNLSLILIDGSADQTLLHRFGVTNSVPEDRADAFHVRTVATDAGRIIAIAGRSPTGAKFGTYRLMEELDLSPGAATVRDLDISESPFLKTRSVSLFNVWRVPVEVIRQCNLESWPAEKIRRNVDMYDRFGFNALETHDRFHEDFLQAVYGISRAQWREKVQSMCARAHEHGMTMFLRQWGNSVALPVKKVEGGFTPFGFNNLVPDIPEERRRWEVEIRDYIVTNYANHIDHLIGHWADAGGIHAGSKATVKDAMLLHNELQAAFRRINPKIETSFNLWWMHNPSGHRGWPGYVDHRSLTSAGVLEKDVIIAQATRSRNWTYSEKVTREIMADGYRAAVWTWRRGDTEVQFGDPGLRIRIHGVMGDYFSGLPESARQLEWHNIERNQHGLASDVNYYVAARLMWNPDTDLEAAVERYCALVFGKANAQAVAEAFLTIEFGRDVERQVSAAIVADPVAGAARARRALERLEKIQLSRNHRSRLPSVVTPQEMLQQIKEALRMIAENANIIAGPLRKVDALIAAKKLDEAEQIRAELEKRASALFGTIAGGMEGLWLRTAIEERFTQGTAATRMMQGFATSRILSLEKQGAGFVIRGDKAGPAFALRRLEPKATRTAKFEVEVKPAASGLSRNGGIAFGQGSTPEQLVRCMVYYRGKTIEILGKRLMDPVRTEIPDLDQEEAVKISVSVDLEKRFVTVEAAGKSVKAALRPELREINWHGYTVEKGTTTFTRMKVKEVE